MSGEEWWTDAYRDYLAENPEGAEGYLAPEDYIASEDLDKNEPWAGKWWAHLYRDYLEENPEGDEGYITPEEYALQAAERRFEFIGPHNDDRRDEDDVCDGCGIEGDCDRMTRMYEPGNTRGVLGIYCYFCDECCGPARVFGWTQEAS